MKFRLSVVTILLSTFALIGILNFLVGKISKNEIPSIEKVSKAFRKPIKKYEPIHKMDNAPISAVAPQINAKPIQEPSELIDTKKVALSPSDQTLIQSVAAMSEASLNKEIRELKTLLEAEDFVGQLDNPNISQEEARVARDTLERYALLGLEGTRRKYLEIEPELKDPLYAHRDSLADIRKILKQL